MTAKSGWRYAPPGRVKENLDAAEVSLSDEDMAAIEARLAGIEATGEQLSLSSK